MGGGKLTVNPNLRKVKGVDHVNTRPWRLKARTNQQRIGARAPQPGAPFSAVVTAVDPATETVTMQHHGGEAPSKGINHPFMSGNAWIRAIPEPGSAVQASKSHTSQSVEPGRYVHNGKDRVASYKEGNGFYRELKHGEVEIMSSGRAYVHASARGNLTLRGGVSSLTLRNENMEIEARTVLHRRSLHTQSGIMLMGSEERYGVVRRRGLVTPAAQRFITVPGTPIAAMEYYRHLPSLRPNLLGTLVCHQEGDMLDDLGAPILGGPISAPLRAKSTWRAESGLDVKAEIDSLGNIGITLPPGAVAGMQIKVPLGMIKLDTTGNILTSLVMIDNLPWRHCHATPFGPTGIPLPS